MAETTVISANSVQHLLSWKDLLDALASGHRRQRAQLGDTLLSEGEKAVLSRTSWVPGLAIGVKTATVVPSNEDLPRIHSICTLFNPDTGQLTAVIEGDLVTRWKTAADSVLGAKLLARPDSRTLAVIGAGAVASSMVEAYHAIFPAVEQILVYNRNKARAEQLVDKISLPGVQAQAVDTVADAVRTADIVTSSTMTTTPIIQRRWIRAGTHIDLIGAFRPDMREADDGLMADGRVFVNARETAIQDTGEIAIPLAAGVISKADILGDLYDLCNGGIGRQSAADITVYKNAGGGHLDVMTASYIHSVFQANSDI